MKIYSKITEEIKAIGLTNDNIHSYGDGFEKAIELCLYAINELKKQDQSLQLLQADVVGQSEKLCDCEIPKPIDPYDSIDKNICRDCKCVIA